MATKKLVAQLMKDWLGFSLRKTTQDETESLSQSYFEAFKAYRDNEIKQAAEEYLMTGDYFPPRPAQITSLIKNADQSKHTRELVERYTCSTCHQKVGAISDGECLDCAAFPAAPTYKRAPLLPASSTDFKMEGRIKCQECGFVGTCIKEPRDTGKWLCRKCYGDLDEKEADLRLAQLANRSVNAKL